jgi:hypothetical protein
MMDFNTLDIGDTFETEEGMMVLTGKNFDENGNLVGVSYQPLQLSE